jgi:glycosyltransferase involved in cell wall biosynthesis
LDGLPDVEVLGYVKDLNDFLSRLGAAVVPLWRGPGVKLKTLTFMGAGVPTVSTPVGVEGIDGLHDHHCLIADDPAGLATQIVRALEEPGLGPTLRREGRRLIAEGYTWEHLGPRFVEAVEAAQQS